MHTILSASERGMSGKPPFLPPMGTTNIWLCRSGYSTVFQAFINDVFRDMLGRWAIVYMDDILVYSDTHDSHVQHVRAVLKRLIDHQLYAKMEKCEFH